jgi:hypothetical protein
MPAAEFPTIVCNPREDVLVRAIDGRDLRRTTYSGILIFSFAGHANYGDWAGSMYLPDSLPYGASDESAIQLAGECSMMSQPCLMYQAPRFGFVADPTDASIRWIQLQLALKWHRDSMLSYRVTALGAPSGPTRL